jgi:hypothetical protein
MCARASLHPPGEGMARGLNIFGSRILQISCRQDFEPRLRRIHEHTLCVRLSPGNRVSPPVAVGAAHESRARGGGDQPDTTFLRVTIRDFFWAECAKGGSNLLCCPNDPAVLAAVKAGNISGHVDFGQYGQALTSAPYPRLNAFAFNTGLPVHTQGGDPAQPQMPEGALSPPRAGLGVCPGRRAARLWRLPWTTRSLMAIRVWKRELGGGKLTKSLGGSGA